LEIHALFVKDDAALVTERISRAGVEGHHRAAIKCRKTEGKGQKLVS
jgi:hypothetical protein